MGNPHLSANSAEMESISKARFDENGAGHLGSYNVWQSLPSALSNFDKMMSAAKGKKIVMFLDYDGTLSQIVDDPEKAFMSNMMRFAVREVSRYFPTAIISGRSRDKIYEFVQLKDIYYAGSHGMDIMAPLLSSKIGDSEYQTKAVDEKGNEVIIFQPAYDFLPGIQEILRALKEVTKGIDGVIIENNKFCISVHFRCVREEDFSTLQEKVKFVMETYPLFHLTWGRKVMEIRPRIQWNKGHALKYLLETLGFDGSTDVFPMYIGDDLTDEDAFKVIKDMGKGYPIIVSSIPKETQASYSLCDPSEVMSFLLRLARWRRSSSSGKLIDFN